MRYGSTFKPLARDSARALADARAFLAGAKSLKGVTAADLSRRHNLSPKFAEYELTIAQQRRSARGE